MEASCWIRQSARAGNTRAYSSVGITYEKGRGVEKNIDEAITWYERAISAGRSGGAYRMELLYREGLGVRADNAEAERYFKLQKELKKTEPEYEFPSTVERKFKSIYQATLHIDRHLLRVLRAVVG